MKTVFKVGMVVYDSVNYPGEKGEVIKTEKDIPYNSRPIQVKFKSNIEDYTLDGRIGTFNQIPTLSTSPYTLQGFEQKAPAPTYEEALKEAHRKDEYYYLPNDLEAPSEELANATVTLLKLLFLRDYYNEGWQPDWTDGDEYKYCIKNFGNELYTIDLDFSARVMTFKTPEIRDKFLEEQKELLEIAKPLL
jgi:hypothetical protein